MGSLISKIREKLGHDKFIHPAARIIVENEHGQVLFIERKDNGLLGLPAGGLEENETIEDCIIREVREETGLELLELELIGISSNPQNETVSYPNKDVIQYFVVEFYCNKWKGELCIHDTLEVKKVFFGDKNLLSHLPNNEQSILKSLEFYKKCGKVRVD